MDGSITAKPGEQRARRVAIAIQERQRTRLRAAMRRIARPPAPGELVSGAVSIQAVAWLVLQADEAISDLASMHSRGDIDAKEFLARSGLLLEGMRAMAGFVSANGSPS